MATKQYNAALYCRLSRDDGKVESVSIQHQRDMLKAYAKEYGYEVYDIYADDGISGTTFDRPEFQRMISDIEHGNVNMVLVKDLSRFGRDHVKSGYYREDFFLNKGVRFIAIQDGYDSTQDDSGMTAIKDVFNEYHARETSKKVKAVRYNAAIQGKFMGSRTPYGYMRNPNNRHTLIADENVAAVVRKIFHMYSIGNSARHIAHILTQENIDPPNEYYFKSLGKSNPFSAKTNAWGAATLTVMLQNKVYIGHTVQGKAHTLSHKLKKRVHVDEKDWIIVENTHEPLIDLQTWENVQSRFERERAARRVGKRTSTRVSSLKELSLFSGMLLCADCAGKMAYNVKSSDGRTYYLYRCSTYANNGRGACSVHAIHQTALETAVLDDIRHYATIALNDRQALIERLMKANASTRQQSMKDCNKKVSDTQKRIREIDGLAKGLFEEKLKGNIPDMLFKNMLADYEREQTELGENLITLRQELADCEANANDTTAWVEKIRQCISIDTLNRDILHELIDSITISESYKVGGKTQQDIIIKYKFVGFLAELKNCS